MGGHRLQWAGEGSWQRGSRVSWTMGEKQGRGFGGRMAMVGDRDGFLAVVWRGAKVCGRAVCGRRRGCFGGGITFAWTEHAGRQALISPYKTLVAVALAETECAQQATEPSYAVFTHPLRCYWKRKMPQRRRLSCCTTVCHEFTKA